VSASDADIGRNAELTYTFANGLTSDNFLSVDPRTGFISSVSTVDRESLIRQLGRDSFQLDIVVSDNGVVRRTTPVAVNVVVVDKVSILCISISDERISDPILSSNFRPISNQKTTYITLAEY
jgi:hypothetical protein